MPTFEIKLILIADVCTGDLWECPLRELVNIEDAQVESIETV